LAVGRRRAALGLDEPALVAAHPLLRAISSLTGSRPLAQSITPRLTFDDVILPPETRRALEQALTQVRRHALIFREWGLGERHATGLGLVFNFAGPPGTGKTICAEAVAHALGRRLLVVRYAEVESMWLGETPKNITDLFRTARDENAVLLFDEADSITSRRSTSPDLGVSRELNAVVNVLLKELDSFRGVVIFATNLAANFDPAFERRIRSQVLFEMPTAAERDQIWRVQVHPRLTPLHDDVDFRSLAERYEATGGDIRNAVLKAATMAALEPGDDASRTIRQAHFEAGIRDVMDGKRVMQQSLFADHAQPAALAHLQELRWLTAGAGWALPLSVAAFVTALVALVAALVR
jgi:SpoVK/Ycf46/Vps4 family AAA+-type ATPase